jgi:hypothetical protein
MVVFTLPGNRSQQTVAARVIADRPGPVPSPKIVRVSDTFWDLDLEPHIAWNGTTHLVVWASAIDWGEDTNVFGARLTDDGSVLDPTRIEISTASDAQDTLAVGANGRFLVTWVDRRSYPDADLHATEVDGNGTVSHPDGFVLAGSIGVPGWSYTGAGAPVTGATGEGTFGVAYDRYLADEPYDATRALIRRVSPESGDPELAETSR